MINSVSHSAGVTLWQQQQATQRTEQPSQPKPHQKQDSVKLSPEAQKAGDVDHDGDSH